MTDQGDAPNGRLGTKIKSSKQSLYIVGLGFTVERSDGIEADGGREEWLV